jgi:hypothetical protein
VLDTGETPAGHGFLAASEDAVHGASRAIIVVEVSMPKLVLSLLIFGALPVVGWAPVSAQSGDVWVTAASGVERGAIRVSPVRMIRVRFTQDGRIGESRAVPVAEVRLPAQRDGGARLTAEVFVVRGWLLNGFARVHVLAVGQDEQGRAHETVISNFEVEPGNSRVVSETASYGAAPIVITAEAR